MTQSTRLQLILDHLRGCRISSVQEISALLQVSSPTIYRDLRVLVRQNLAVLKKGKVWLCNEETVITPLYHRNVTHVAEKQQIAQAAAGLLRDGMVVFLDASSTAGFLAERLDRFSGLTVLTNGLLTAMLLRQRGVDTVCVGGPLIENALATRGKIACDTVGSYHIDMAFFSSQAVTEAGMICDASEYETALRRFVLQRADTTVFLCDRSKFGAKAVFCVAPLQEIDYLVTDGAPGKKARVIKQERR